MSVLILSERFHTPFRTFSVIKSRPKLMLPSHRSRRQKQTLACVATLSPSCSRKKNTFHPFRILKVTACVSFCSPKVSSDWFLNKLTMLHYLRKLKELRHSLNCVARHFHLINFITRIRLLSSVHSLIFFTILELRCALFHSTFFC